MQGLVLDHVSKSFGGQAPVFTDLSLAIEAGSFVALLGPSGCGKSTLLRILAGLEVATGNSGKALSSSRRSFVFQDANLLPWRTALGNVELPLELSGAGPEERSRRARAALERVGLADAVDLYPRELSGGMRMRVSLARALVTDPEVLFLDEPFAALDEPTRHQLDYELRELWLERKITVVFVTHSISEALYVSDRLVILKGRPAQIVMDRPSPLLSLGPKRALNLRIENAFSEALRELTGAL